jgi:lipid II:glycine glycyltransferase (peptidoglycan interpeptide bridge formation enzyme)
MASRQRLTILSRNRALDISFVRDKAGDILAASSYIVTPSRVRGLYAGASYRATTDPSRRTAIGRANRYLYWRDMLRFKEAGIRMFDFGGYYIGSEDEEKLRVNGFKAEFGGEIIHEFNCQSAVTIKGKLALWGIEQRARRMVKRRLQGLQSQSTWEKRHESSVPS